MLSVIGESVLITGIAFIPALALSLFIYEYTIIHVIAVGITVLTLLLFSVISAWYPARIASKVNPSEALQYE
jgi:ABC-type antimicrobial peptide transport system permease subunit